MSCLWSACWSCANFHVSAGRRLPFLPLRKASFLDPILRAFTRILGDKHQSAFFDIRVFNPYAPSNSKSTMESMYRRHEREKRRCYERILEVEHGSFTPLVFSAEGEMGFAGTVMYKRLASLLADKYAQSYSKTMS